MRIKLSRMAPRLNLFIIISATILISGCASPDIARLVARTKSTPFYTVTVNFDGDSCPTSVSPPTQVGCAVSAQNGLCAEPGKAVQWVSNPPGTAFVVYFDPFVGRPYASRGPDETTRPVIIRRDSLAGDYKYSVLGVVCTGANPVLDPPLRVEY